MAVEMTYEALVSALDGVTTVTNDGVTEGVTVNGTTANVYNVAVISRNDTTLHFPATLVNADLSGVSFNVQSGSPYKFINMFTEENTALVTLKFGTMRNGYYGAENVISACPNLKEITLKDVSAYIINMIISCPNLETVIVEGMLKGSQASGRCVISNLITGCPRLKYVRLMQGVYIDGYSAKCKLISNNDSINNDLTVVIDKGIYLTCTTDGSDVSDLFKNAGLKSIKCPYIYMKCTYNSPVSCKSAFEGNPNLTEFNIPRIDIPLVWSPASELYFGRDIDLTNMFKGCTSLKYINLSCLKTKDKYSKTKATCTDMLSGVSDATVLYNSKLVSSAFTGHAGTGIKFIDMNSPSNTLAMQNIAIPSMSQFLGATDFDIISTPHLHKHTVEIKLQQVSSAPIFVGKKTIYTTSEKAINSMSALCDALGTFLNGKYMALQSDGGYYVPDPTASPPKYYSAVMSFLYYGSTNAVSIKGYYAKDDSTYVEISTTYSGVAISDTVTQLF